MEKLSDEKYFYAVYAGNRGGGERIRFNLSYYNMHSQIAKVIKASLCKNVLLYSVCMKYKRRGYCFSAESARTLG